MRWGGCARTFPATATTIVGINNVELTKNALLIGSMKFRQRMGSVHYLTLTGNYALSASKLRYLLEQDTMFGCGIGYGLDSMFGPLEASLNYANRANKVSMYVNLGLSFDSSLITAIMPSI